MVPALATTSSRGTLSIVLALGNTYLGDYHHQGHEAVQPPHEIEVGT
jgi:hypothetical protein